MLSRVRVALDSDKMQLMQDFKIKYWQDIYDPQYGSTTTIIRATRDETTELIEAKSCSKPSYSKATVTGQLGFLIEKVGLNISQLADLLKVGRQSIYKWRDGTDIRKANLYRLDDLYSVFMRWDNISSVKIGSYLYKKIAGELSLYDLLIADTIDVEKAKSMATEIEHILLDASDRVEQRREKLQDAGFKPASKEQKDKVLNNLIRKS